MSSPRGGLFLDLARVAVFYAACLTIATWPYLRGLGSRLPDLYDSLQHLWIMRWYRTCLLEGRLVFHCPEIQHPLGAPLGNFSALHLQSLLYLPLSSFIPNDPLCYNILWVLGLVGTGLGTYVLAWHLLRDRGCAAFGGLAAMLSTPLLMHAQAHLELIYVGGFPLFLAAWMRFVDRPDRGRLVLAALGYLVVAMSAAYYMVFALFPAVLYVVWQAARAGSRGEWGWFRIRGWWFLGFAMLVLPGLLVLFSSQLWALAHGESLTRPRNEFDLFSAPLWGYFIPTRAHRLGTWLPLDRYAALGSSAAERASYLGVVTLVLLACAALARARFPRSGYLWSALGLLVILALGAHAEIGGRTIRLPSDWLWRWFPLYRVTRVPARFNLFAAVLAAVLAAAGLRHLLARLPRSGVRRSVLAALAALAVADLRVPMTGHELPALPSCYAFLEQRDPRATLVEVPTEGLGGSPLNARCTYWQAQHRLTTSAGYSGHANRRQAAQAEVNSPFADELLARPDFLADPAHVAIDVVQDVDFCDYVWLYLTVNRFDYVVLHHAAAAALDPAVRLDRLKAVLTDTRIYEDAATIVYARSRLRPPRRPVALCLEEWQDRSVWNARRNCRVPASGRVVVYKPEPAGDLTMVVSAGSQAREIASAPVVTIRAGSTRLGRWALAPGGYHDWVSGPLRLPAGLSVLTFESDHPGDRDAVPRTPRARIAGIALYSAAQRTAVLGASSASLPDSVAK